MGLVAGLILVLVMAAQTACATAQRLNHHARPQAACGGPLRLPQAPHPARGNRAGAATGGLFGISAGGNLQDEPPGLLAADVAADRAAGANWLRFDVNWVEIQSQGPRRYDWRLTDHLVRAAQRCGLHLLGTILYTPAWARPAGTSPTYGPAPAQYATFAAVAARHLARMGVHAYEIWNEPNIQASWTPAPSARAYTEVLKAAYVAIKGADPAALVITGGTSPSPNAGQDIAPTDFLAGIYAHGGRAYFDAVGHHPYCYPAFPGEAKPWSSWYRMYAGHGSLRTVMIRHGDRGKRIWATEFGAPTAGPDGTHVSPARQAAMITRAYKLFARYPWAGPLFTYQGRDLGTDAGNYGNFFGLISRNFRPKPSFRAYQRSAAAL